MLYTIFGSDRNTANIKAKSLADSLRAKKPDASFVVVNRDNWHSSVISEHLGGQGLFSNKYIIFLDRVMESSDAEEVLVDFLPAMHESENIFIVLEGELKAEPKRAFTKSSEKLVECAEKVGNGVKSKKEPFNIFALGDAVGSRDAVKSWVLYRKAIDAGLEPENILGTLFWQVKSIILSANAKTATEAGISPFVFGNCKRFAKNYSEAELNSMFRDIIGIYHDSHRGLVDSELALESLLLRTAK